MDYVRGATFVLGILIIISGLYFVISASNIFGVLLGMTGIVLGIVFTWKIRKSGKQEKRLKKWENAIMTLKSTWWLHSLLLLLSYCWTCFICGEVVQRFSLVVSHVEKHKQDEHKPSSLFDVINEEWRENK